jgi:hypothetical protein
MFLLDWAIAYFNQGDGGLFHLRRALTTYKGKALETVSRNPVAYYAV